MTEVSSIFPVWGSFPARSSPVMKRIPPSQGEMIQGARAMNGLKRRGKWENRMATASVFRLVTNRRTARRLVE